MGYGVSNVPELLKAVPKMTIIAAPTEPINAALPNNNVCTSRSGVKSGWINHEVPKNSNEEIAKTRQYERFESQTWNVPFRYSTFLAIHRYCRRSRNATGMGWVCRPSPLH